MLKIIKLLSVFLTSICLVVSFFQLNKSISVFTIGAPKENKKIIIDAGHGGLTNTID